MVVETLNPASLSQSFKQNSEYLTTIQAAKYLNFSRQWLEIARHKGEGPSYIKMARMVRYAISDLDEFMQSHRRNNTIGGGL